MFEELFSSTGLSLERLRSLCEVAEAGNIAAATPGDGNRQSLFSRQISELEQYFGVKLLDRRSRPHKLSREGEVLARLSKNYLSGLHDFRANCLNQPVNIVLGAGESNIQWLLMPKLDQILEEVPEASISMTNLRTLEIVRQLEEGDLDVGLIRKTALTPQLRSVGSIKYGYRLFVPKRMRRKLDETVTVEQVGALPLAIISGKGEFRSQLEHLATKASTKLDVRLECSSHVQVASAVLSGKYVGVLPDFAASMLATNGVADHKIRGFEKLKRELVFAWSPKQASLRPVIEKAIGALAK